MQYFKVSADHVSSQYSCKDTVARVREDTSTPSVNGHSMSYYVSMPNYGCSKMYHTPRDAITCMLLNHGCTNIKIDPLSEEEARKLLRIQEQIRQIRILSDQERWTDVAELAKRFAEEDI